MTLYYESALEHHGIKGQRWGVRRFQNKDGSLKPAGRRHIMETQKGLDLNDPKYGKPGHTKSGNPAIKSPVDLVKDSLAPKKYSVTTKQTTNHEDYNRAHTKKKASEMSDKELRERLNRLDMERRYNQMNPSTMTKGKNFIKNSGKALGTAVFVTGSAITLYKNAGKIKEIVDGIIEARHLWKG